MDKKKKSAGSSCEYCMNYEYDEDYEYYVCTQDLDQDEMYRFITGYKARERIHRAVADARLLANPASWSRVADSSPN